MERHRPRGLTVAPATARDLPGVRAIAHSYGNLHEWPDRPDYLDFELRERGPWVVRNDAAVVGFTGIVRSGERTHLADLFVARDHGGVGIGGRLLGAALPAEGLRTTFASGDERALPLYVRAGLQPLAPLLYLTGGALTPGAAAERIEVSAIGRSPALDFLAEVGAYALTAGDGHAVVRAAPGGACLGPGAAGADDLLALVAAAAAEHGSVKLALPGPHPALRALLEAGLRIVAADTFMASGPGALDLEREFPDADLG